MTMGVGAALIEELAVDTRVGFFVNHDLAGYEVPVHADIPHQEVIFLDETDPTSSPMKARGVGELGICGVSAAVANAIYNATGVRVPIIRSRSTSCSTGCRNRRSPPCGGAIPRTSHSAQPADHYLRAVPPIRGMAVTTVDRPGAPPRTRPASCACAAPFWAFNQSTACRLGDCHQKSPRSSPILRSSG
jgi:hypothetical protein